MMQFQCFSKIVAALNESLIVKPKKRLYLMLIKQLPCVESK